ncbi:hypothetical protein IFM89_002170 [Coptis chinensis]|uniref:At1g61320/AtMIF1 LRR domain-containing protein n=1 Tax=Coptis chinensis TaxID=261450 RepID=A0A835I923_9MAGN|nr:hypothetical protein IFM89_002170 [Coptis chinensis]
MDKFTCFVNHTLSLLKCDSIQEFSLDFSDLSPEVVNAGRMEGMRRFALQVDRWIRWAVTKKVKVLYLNLADSKGPMYGFPYKVPGHIFSNDSITELLLCVCRLNPFRPIRWNNLKSLFLYDILLSDELIQNILSGTPLLEVIRLSECKGMRKVIITNPNLKGLALVCSSGPWIELSAPHVQTLEISGDMEQDRLKNVSSLLGGQVIPEGQTIDDSFQNLLRRTFESVRHAIVLGLSTRCLQEMKICCKRTKDGSETTSFTSDDMLKFSQKLLCSRRASSGAR